ncbi:MAG: hypothetical protein MZV70_39405 [Desulfobacterales bacterium]|nr:hypothetical protein [Desulfobacterales bacterium]
MPAGYEFQKIASDFQRLIEGKALFDGDALEAIVEATDNNVRAESLETFAENVLPLYDDLQAVYPEIITGLVAAADRARVTPPAAVETPYGTLPAKAYTRHCQGHRGHPYALSIYRRRSHVRCASHAIWLGRERG